VPRTGGPIVVQAPVLPDGRHEKRHGENDVGERDAHHARTYQIGTVARLVHLSLRTLRYWEEEGLISPTARTTGGFRMYSPEDVARVRLVRSMKAADLSIDELRELVALVTAVEEAGPARDAARERLSAVVRRVRERLEILRSRMEETEEAALWLEALAGDGPVDVPNPFHRPLDELG